MLVTEFGSVAGAFDAREEHYKAYQPPKSEWSIKNRKITHDVLVKTDLLPTEKLDAHFIVMRNE